MTEPLLEICGLRVEFALRRSSLLRPRGSSEVLHAVDDVSFGIRSGEVLGLVGESGCGKSTLGTCIVGLTKPTAGQVIFRGQPLPAKRTKAQHRLIQMVFQDPYSSLNPRMTVRQVLAELLHVHRIVDSSHVSEQCAELLRLVGLGRQALEAYPRQLSGGQRQRVAIARALALEPQVLVADEPVSALDVSVQATVLNLLQDLRSQLGGMTMLFISHNLAVVRHVSDRVAVMYLGRIVEIASTEALFGQPLHPYTHALLAAVPRMQRMKASGQAAITGDPPSPVHLPSGCRFHPRCPKAQDICREREPELSAAGNDALQSVACHFPGPSRSGAAPISTAMPVRRGGIAEKCPTTNRSMS